MHFNPYLRLTNNFVSWSIPYILIFYKLKYLDSVKFNFLFGPFYIKSLTI